MKEIKTKRIQSGRVILVALGAIAITAVLLVMITTSSTNKVSHTLVQAKSTSTVSTTLPTTFSLPVSTSTTSSTVPTHCPASGSGGPDTISIGAYSDILEHHSFLPLSSWDDLQMPLCYSVTAGAVTVGGANNDTTPVAGALLVLTESDGPEFFVSGQGPPAPPVIINGASYYFPPNSLFLAPGDGTSPLYMVSVSNGIIKLKSRSGLNYTFNVNTLQWVGQ